MESIAVRKDCRMKSEADREQFESIYYQYYRNVHNYICFRINNHFDAEELSSLVFVKAMSRWSSYNSDFPVEAWLIGIAKNTVTDYLRGKKGKYFVALDTIIDMVSSAKQPEDIVLIKEENRALMVAMAKLKSKERQILSMKFATDLKYHEIAKMLGIGDSNAKMTAHRALKKLRKFMEENAHER